ncbi:MAG: hypothetical protein M3133_09070 [Actinomycetota bacterium]|nr:hypothetical protein [Actinomycetota bacterium]
MTPPMASNKATYPERGATADSRVLPRPVKRAVRALGVRTVAFVTCGCVVALGVLGVLDATVGVPLPFYLDGEGGAPALFSAGLLVAGGALAVLLGAGRLAPGGPVTWLALAAFLAFMALDELLGVHEALERRTGIDWQLLYSPVVLVGGMAWLRALQALRRGHVVARRLLMGGAAAWLAAQILEDIQWTDGDRLVYPWMIVPEEMLEMTGSMLFGLAFFVLLKAAVGPVPPEERRPTAAETT